MSSRWNRSLVPVSQWGSWGLWRAGHQHRLPAQVCDQEKKERKEKENNLLLLSLRASRAFVEQPGLVTSPRSHQPIAKNP